MTLDNEIRAAVTGKTLNLDKKLTSNVSSILNDSIQFLPAVKPYESVTNLLKSKYIRVTDEKSVNGFNNRVENGDEKFQTCLNTTPSTSSDYKHDLIKINKPPSGGQVPAPQFHIFPADLIQIRWENGFRYSTGVGLNNLGNTCFLNSVLQVLTNTAPLVNYLFSNDHSVDSCVLKQSGYCSLCALRIHINKTFQLAKSRCAESFSPGFIVGKIRCVMKSHVNGRQEDAHEFLRYFVDSMQNSSLHRYKDRKLDLFTKETTAISRIFGGFHKNAITCNNCHSISTTFDPFLDISLEIKQQPNVEAALQHFTRSETLSLDNAYKCPKCNLKVTAKKMYTIHQSPNVLTIQLKRFDHFGKIDRHVSFPEYLNIRPYMTDKMGPPVSYKLYGVVVHSGRTTNSGHYFAFVKNPLDQWHLMDDSRVCVVRPHQVLTSCAYLLFYVRQSVAENNNKLQSSYMDIERKNNVNISTNHRQQVSPYSLNNKPAIVPNSIVVSTVSNNYQDNVLKKPDLSGSAVPEKRPQKIVLKFRTKNSISNKILEHSTAVAFGNGVNEKKNSSKLESECKSSSIAESEYKLSIGAESAEHKSSVSSESECKVSSNPNVVSEYKSNKSEDKSTVLNGLGVVDRSLTMTLSSKRVDETRVTSPTPSPKRIKVEQSVVSPLKTPSTEKNWHIWKNGGDKEASSKSSTNGDYWRELPEKVISNSVEEKSPEKTISTPNNSQQKILGGSRPQSSTVSATNGNGIRKTTTSKFTSPLEFLTMHGANGYGDSVKSWTGETNSVDRVENGVDRKRKFEDSNDTWNDEYDTGKMKKVKHKHRNYRSNNDDYHRNHFNRFQHTQDDRNRFQYGNKRVK